MKIKFLKAHNGDAILISVLHNGLDRNILIDGGIGDTYRDRKGPKGKPVDGSLKRVINDISSKDQKIDLLVLTHVDDDHIGGILRWFEEDDKANKLINSVWFNSGKTIAKYLKIDPDKIDAIEINQATNYNTSIQQGIEFEDYLKLHKLWNGKLIKSGDSLKVFGLTFDIISPDIKRLLKLLKKWDREKPDYLTSAKGDDYHLSLMEHIKNDKFKQDNAVHNGSSIAFILKHRDKKWLFLADAHPRVIIESLKDLKYSEDNPLEVEFVKLSHHGSKGNNSRKMLRMISTDNFIVSTNGQRHEHPHKQMLSRIIAEHPKATIWFNYGQRIEKIFTLQDSKDFQDFNVAEITQDFQY